MVPTNKRFAAKVIGTRKFQLDDRMLRSALISAMLFSLPLTGPVFAQDADPAQTGSAPGQNLDPRIVQNTRGNIPIPTNTEELRLVSLELWLKFRRTNQRLYNFIGEAAEFRAYSYICKRHDLNVNLSPINQLADRHIKQIILAHYEEPDYAVLETMEKSEQARLMTDIAADIYGFEYGYRLSEQTAIIDTTGSTTNNFCLQVEKVNYGKYIALLATARRQIN